MSSDRLTFAGRDFHAVMSQDAPQDEPPPQPAPRRVGRQKSKAQLQSNLKDRMSTSEDDDDDCARTGHRKMPRVHMHSQVSGT